jgi:N-acetylmuramoyl-L-alanine amidase
MRIIGPPSSTLPHMQTKLPGLGATNLFIYDMLQPLWDAATDYGIDPVGMVAQSFKETGGGTFKGKAKPEFRNTAGIKNRESLFPGVDDDDNPLAHARFASWEVGALAHAQHLCAYTGIDVNMSMFTVIDPRYDFARRTSPGTWVENWSDLGGKWAPSPTYGAEIELIMTRLQTP